MAEAEVFPTPVAQLWTYLGASWDGSTLGHHYRPEIEDGHNWSFNKNIIQGARPGAQYMVFLASPDKVKIAGEYAPVYKGLVDDQERARLELDDREAQARARMAKQAKNDMSTSALEEALRPIIQEYSRRNRTGKAALLGSLIEIVSRV